MVVICVAGIAGLTWLCLAVSMGRVIALVLGLFAAMSAVMCAIEKRRLRRLRAQHIVSHCELSDVDFVSSFGAPREQWEIAVGIRTAIGKTMGVPPATIHPRDSLHYIMTFGFDNMDFIELVVEMEDVLGARLSDDIMKQFKLESQCVADLVRFVAANWESLVESANRSALHN
jgi:acyl carrier protein